MTRPRGSVPRFLSIRHPAPEAPGIARAEWQTERAGRPSLRIVAEARTDHEGPAVTVHEAGGPTWRAGLEWAALRWSEGEGPPDLTLGWPGQPNHGTPTYAMVSDALRLATDRDAQWAVRALWAALPPLGRPPGLTTITDDEEIKAPVRALRAAKRRVTLDTVVAYAGTFTRAELRGYLRVTGRTWREFLDSF